MLIDIPTSSTRSRVLVAMSGGVDSSVAACLLHEQGYDVMGVFLRLGAEPAALSSVVSLPVCDTGKTKPDRHRGCCSALDASDARAVAGKLGIPFYALNYEREFSRLIDYFVDEYAAARTPNPCVMCNQWLKFGKLASFADAVGADFIATGHYARLDHAKGRCTLRRALYTDKDQSYVLFGIAPEVLRRTLFPLGILSKSEVREHARRFGLALHDKPDSQDICFVPDGNYAAVVQSRRRESFRPGEIRHVDGRRLGEHRGIPNYTVGQRRGLGVAIGSPLYVSRLEPETDTVVVGPSEAISTSEAHAERMHWLAIPPTSRFKADVRIRYNHEAAAAEVNILADNRVSVLFNEPQWAVTPGQALVIYDADEVLGGGWIA